VFLGEEEPEFENLSAPAILCDIFIDPVFVAIGHILENLDGLLSFLADGEFPESTVSS